MQIIIEKLKVEAYIGVLTWEQATAQTLWIDLTLPCPENAGCQDTLSSTLDYVEVIDKTVKFIKSKPWQLLETLHRALAEHLRETFHVSYVHLTIHKPFAMQQMAHICITHTYHFS